MKFHILAASMALAITSIALAGSEEPIQSIKAAKIANPEQVELGKKLYFDPRLSKSGFTSCNSCHNLSMGGTDNLKTVVGDHRHEGPINTPTVLNSSMDLARFWDDRAKDLQAQAAGPIANPGEMSSNHVLVVEVDQSGCAGRCGRSAGCSNHALVVKVIQSIPGYVTEFKKVFGRDQVTIEEITEAIAAFEETLVTPNSRFDKWLKGDKKAITAEELAGYNLFKESGCIACHNGPAVGGNTFQKMGLVEPYKTTSPAERRKDVTGEDADCFLFKVPMLRNVELTYPYFHDGAVNTLKEAVNTMGRIQLGKKFTDEENARIVAFLKSLTGEQPSFNLPILPPSSDRTPRPQ